MAFLIPNRPFAVEPITGLMLPDGIFEVSIGKQTINTHVKNNAATASVQVYVESVSDPGIAVTPATFSLPNAATGVAHLFSWQADFSSASPGAHRISFIIETPSGDQRIIKKIFVTKVGYNPTTGSFTATTPEGVLDVALEEMVRPRDGGCCNKRQRNCHCDDKEDKNERSRQAAHAADEGPKNTNVLEYLRRGFENHDPDFEFCLPGYLPKKLHATMTPTPAYTGQYGDLPFQDPWWKAVLGVIAGLLAIAGAIAEAVDGEGEVTVSGGGSTSGSETECCGVQAEGGGTS